MIERVRKQCHKDIGAGKSADILDKLSDENDIEIGRSDPTYSTAKRIEKESDNRDIFLAEFLCKRPDGENSDPHRDSAKDRDERLRDSVRIRSEHIIAVVRKRHVLELAGDRIEQEIAEQNQHELIRKHCFELQTEGNLFLIRLRSFLRKALLGKVVLDKNKRKREAGEYAHTDDPKRLARSEGRNDEHREHQSNDNPAHHDRTDVVEYCKHTALRSIAR